MLNWIVRNRSVWSFKSVYQKMFTNHIFNMYGKTDLALNNQQRLIRHKTKQNQTRPCSMRW